jgi:sulfatase maturation enzyme AslB (radical SAM superfamily)
LTDQHEKREQVAGERRHWLRINRACNNRCMFCHDSNLHDGVMIAFETLASEISAARESGAARLIISGGEPTIHPRFIDLVSHARASGFAWVQAISNGRMFAYRDFAARAAAAGLSEVTVSIHGPDGALNDTLTGVAGSFAQTTTGIKNLLLAGCHVSVDVVINALNFARLQEIVRTFTSLGIREFDLLYITPFGRAWDFNRELLIPLERGRPPSAVARSLADALDEGDSCGATMWTNRIPPELLEGREQYIQDPHKLLDEVRGRQTEFKEVLGGGVMRCRQEERCALCFIKGMCDALHDEVKGAGKRPPKSPRGVVLNAASAIYISEDAVLQKKMKKGQPRLIVPTYSLASEAISAGFDPSLARKIASLVVCELEGLPRCLGGTPTPDHSFCKAGGAGPDLDLFAFAEDYINRRLMTKSLRCAACRHDVACPGIHINHARAWGYGMLRPIKRQ